VKVVRTWTRLLLCMSLSILFFTINLLAANKCIKEGFSVALDAGHSKLRPGAISARGVPEHDFNQEIIGILYKEMLTKGYKCVLTISEDAEDNSLITRADIANKQASNLLISVHHDSVQPRYLKEWTFYGKKRLYSDQFKGFSVFYSEKNEMPERSLLFAKALGTEMLKEGFTPSLHHAEKIEGENRELVDSNRGIYKYNELIILKYAKMPAVLLECGIIVNRDEEVMLGNSANQKRMVLAVLRGIEKYCKLMGEKEGKELNSSFREARDVETGKKGQGKVALGGGMTEEEMRRARESISKMKQE
jgi:N-acetylmuramoyl-L-alanine amidase